MLNAIRYPGKVCNKDLLICKHFHDFGNYLSTAFLDDLLLIGTCLYRTKLLTDAALELANFLAICWHAHKCSLQPKQVIDHLGYRLIINE